MTETCSTPRIKRRKCGAILLLLGVVLLYLFAWPVNMDPVVWNPPSDAGYTGEFAMNNALVSAQQITLADSAGPEDVAVDAEGRLYVGVLDGRILRLDPVTLVAETFADTKGRPLGLAFDTAGNLVVADAVRGLLRLDPTGAIETLATEHAGVPFRVTDDVDIALDGTIYFTDASSKYGLDHFINDLLEQRGTGRLMSYEPETGETTLLMEGLCFANGVAVAPDESFVLVVETGRYRVHRYWLAGENAGTSEIIIDNLPGYPDGVSAGAPGRYWIALVSPRKKLVDTLHPYPWAKKIILRLPMFLRPAPPRTGHVIAIDEMGNVVQNLHDPMGQSAAIISSVEEHEGVLYFGSYMLETLGRIPVPEER